MSKKSNPVGVSIPKPQSRIPDPQIGGAADQYCAAAILLYHQPPCSGVLLPLLTTAALSIELYLKCLNAQEVCYPSEQMSDVYRITSQPQSRTHPLSPLFDSLKADVKRSVEESYSRTGLNKIYPALKNVLDKYSNLFVDSRYAFERTDAALSDVKPDHLIQLVEFLRDFVHHMPETAVTPRS